MVHLLCLETSGVSCSVCLTADDRILEQRTLNTGSFTHAEKLHIFIEEILKQTKLKGSDIDAVAVSEGPGSYTGLRIGVSSAKGLCFAWNVPLIAVPTLQILAKNINIPQGYIIPMLDARRMEVYTAVFDENHTQVEATQPLILDENSFQNWLEKSKVSFLGDGSDKFAEICKHPNAFFVKNQFPTAEKMASLAFERFTQKQFEDVAYFEPFYLKNFQI